MGGWGSGCFGSCETLVTNTEAELEDGAEEEEEETVEEEEDGVEERMDEGSPARPLKPTPPPPPTRPGAVS